MSRVPGTRPHLATSAGTCSGPCFKTVACACALGLLFDKQDFLEKKLHNAAMVVAASQYYFGPAYDHANQAFGLRPRNRKRICCPRPVGSTVTTTVS